MEYKIIDWYGLDTEELEAEINRLAGEESWEPVFPIPGGTCILLRRQTPSYLTEFERAMARITPATINIG